VVPTVNGENLRAVLDEQVDAPATHLHTDYGPHYHKIVGDYFSQLKRSLDGTHHKVSREHLDRYLAEFDFRHSTRKASDTERMAMLGQRIGGRRLTYRRVAGS